MFMGHLKSVCMGFFAVVVVVLFCFLSCLSKKDKNNVYQTMTSYSSNCKMFMKIELTFVCNLNGFLFKRIDPTKIQVNTSMYSPNTSVTSRMWHEVNSKRNTAGLDSKSSFPLTRYPREPSLPADFLETYVWH